ncbi:hypothetical protein OIU78_015987 [Salix suchowensis]|nr:hypothetical protein OIU78_015987 [Salix suchowensis]
MLEQKQQQGILWSPKERECLFLLQRCRTRKTLLQIHALILRNAIDANVNILTKFITTCGQLSSISHARHLFDNRSNRDDTFLCNSMIRSHVVMRQFASAFNLYKDLRRETCFVPDNFTFTVLAKCCALRMAVWEGLEMHGHVVKIGFCFDMYVSTTLVDMYAKFGNLGLARRVFNDMTDRSLVSWTALIGGMPFEANGIILSSSLFACGFSKDVTRAQRVLNQAVNMEPHNDGNYVMVRNLYAMEEWWRAVKEIKGLMRRSGAKKEVGSSAIEVDSRVSEFISGGIAHPEWDVIECDDDLFESSPKEISIICILNFQNGLSSTPLMSLFRSWERFEQIYGRTLPFILHSEQYMQLRADSVIWANNDSSTALSENGS